MRKKTILIAVFCLLSVFPGYSQQSDSVPKPRNHFSLAISTGWSHYINSLKTVNSDEVNKDFVGVNMRFLWEPGYRLGLGLETGFYRIFRIKKEFTPEITGESNLYCFPLLLVVRMRVVDHFYLSVAPGLAVLVSKISGIQGTTVSTQWSYANFEVTASYLYPVSRHFSFGGEARIFLIGKVNDFMYTLQATCAVTL